MLALALVVIPPLLGLPTVLLTGTLLSAPRMPAHEDFCDDDHHVSVSVPKPTSNSEAHSTAPMTDPFTSSAMPMPPPGARPPVDTTRPETFGIHLAYISAEVHSISRNTHELAESLAALTRTLPITYAQSAAFNEVTKRVDALEAYKDRSEATSPTFPQLATQLNEIARRQDRIESGLAWTKAFITAFIIPIAALTVAVIKLFIG